MSFLPTVTQAAPAWTANLLRAETDDEDDGVARLRFVGVLDAMTSRDLRPTIDATVARRPRRLVVDLGELRMLDSTGVGVLIALWKGVKAAGGEVNVVGAREQPLAVLEILKLDRVLGL
jgi:anti-sigma B factor antagonist